MSKPFEHYLQLASRVLRREGLIDTDPAELAEWARSVDAVGPIPHGVVIDSSARVVATTTREDDLPNFSMYFVDDVRVPAAREFIGQAVPNALTPMKLAIGGDVLHLAAGAILRQGKGSDEQGRAKAAALHEVWQARYAVEWVNGTLRRMVLAGVEAGVPDARLAVAAGVNPATIWRWKNAEEDD